MRLVFSCDLAAFAHRAKMGAFVAFNKQTYMRRMLVEKTYSSAILVYGDDLIIKRMRFSARRKAGGQ